MAKILAMMNETTCFNLLQFADDCPQEIIDFVVQEQGATSYIEITPESENWGVGCTWHIDHWRTPSPYPSWVWDEERFEEDGTRIAPQWVAPVPLPEDVADVNYIWNEEEQRFDRVD